MVKNENFYREKFLQMISEQKVIKTENEYFKIFLK